LAVKKSDGQVQVHQYEEIMNESFRTEGASRALANAALHAHQDRRRQAEPMDLLFALLADEESQATVLLTRFGMTEDARIEWVTARSGLAEAGESDISETAQESPVSQKATHSQALKMALADADLYLRAIDRSRPVGTEEILYGLISSNKEAAREVQTLVSEMDRLKAYFHRQKDEETELLPLPEGCDPLVLMDSVETADIARIIDAASNRVREGLRVIEDYARFALDDPSLTRGLKDVRHRLKEAMTGFPAEMIIPQRDTKGDVGTHIMAVDEGIRTSPRDVLVANFKRVTEALRSLEEYAKLFDVWVSGRFEVLRYDLYTLEKRMILAVTGVRTLGSAKLCLLIGNLPTLGDLTWVVSEAIEGGVDFIQLREKNRPDRVLLEHARELRILTAKAGVLFAVNDRVDIARIASADAVHLGQDDFTVRDARRLVGPRMMMGVSTHEPGQLRKAVTDGAQYLGVGPVFSSRTKNFDESEIAGLGYVRHVSEETTLPWFAIGGIDTENVDQVIEAGASRVAVSSAILKAERPRVAARILREKLDRI
jgi:thiamine-phosphate pyrophosphorylase